MQQFKIIYNLFTGCIHFNVNKRRNRWKNYTEKQNNYTINQTSAEILFPKKNIQNNQHKKNYAIKISNIHN